MSNTPPPTPPKISVDIEDTHELPQPHAQEDDTNAPLGDVPPTDDVETEGSDTDDLDETLNNTKHHANTTKELMFMMLEGPGEVDHPWLSYVSKFLLHFNTFIVVISCASFTIETLPSLIYTNNPVLGGIEILCSSWFTFDIVARFLTCPDKVAFLISGFTIVDVAAILPFYVELFSGDSAAQGLVMVRILRLARVIRILKLSKHNLGMQAVIETFSHSTDSLILLFLLFGITIVMFSSVIYFVEIQSLHWNKDKVRWELENGRPSAFQSVPDAFWWCIVTITTVGFGDAVPSSGAGKAVAGLCVLSGVFVIAFPTIILGATFQEVYFRKMQQHRNRVKKQQQIKLERLRKKKSSEVPFDPPPPFKAFTVGSPRKEKIIDFDVSSVGGDRKGKMAQTAALVQHPSWKSPVAAVSEVSGMTFTYGEQPRPEGRKIYRHKDQKDKYYYDPLLEFKVGTDARGALDVKWEQENDLHSASSRNMVTLTLLLDTMEAQAEARARITAMARPRRRSRASSVVLQPPSEVVVDVPRDIVARAKTISHMNVVLNVSPTSRMVGTTLVTQEFSSPMGAVFLSLVLPEGMRVMSVPQHIRDLSFEFVLTYAPEATVNISLSAYQATGFRKKSFKSLKQALYPPKPNAEEE